MPPARVIPVVSLLALVGACASIHPGHVAKQANGEPVRELVVSAREVSELSSPALGLVEVTFENRTWDWMRVQSVTLDFGDPVVNAHVHAPGGAELARWTEAIEQRNAMRNHNAAVAWSVFAGAAAVGAGVARGTRAAPIGAAVFLGAVTGSLATSMDARRDAVETTSLYPSNHLFAPDLVIPPGLFVRRFILLQSKDDRRTGYLDQARIQVETESRIHNLRVRFRRRCSSEWQDALCGPPVRRMPLFSERR